MPPGLVPPKTKTAPKEVKKPWVKPANWEQKTQARWAANHPQPLFPSTDISPAELSRLRGSAQTQVRQTYAASPMPSQQSYLQPFADAHARTLAAGQNYVSYLDSAASNAQNISGAFNSALTGGIQQGQAQTLASGGSGLPGAIPTAAASLIPAAGVGSSFTNYLNAEKPYVGAAVNETERQLNSQQSSATADYQTAAAQRRAEIQDAISKLYESNVSTLQDTKVAANKAKVTEYLALGKTAYQKAQVAERAGEFGVSAGLKKRGLDQKDRSLDQTDRKIAGDLAYKQASLDAKRTSAKATGIDLSGPYKTLLVSTPGKTSAPGVKTGPAGQTGREYTVTPIIYTASGTAIEGKPVKRTVYYGETVPTATKDKEGRVTQRVAKGKYTVPAKSGSAAATRKATPDSWDRAVAQLRAKYPGRITATWLKANFPPRPSGS